MEHTNDKKEFILRLMPNIIAGIALVVASLAVIGVNVTDVTCENEQRGFATLHFDVEISKHLFFASIDNETTGEVNTLYTSKNGEFDISSSPGRVRIIMYYFSSSEANDTDSIFEDASRKPDQVRYVYLCKGDVYHVNAWQRGEDDTLLDRLRSVL